MLILYVIVVIYIRNKEKVFHGEFGRRSDSPKYYENIED